MAEARPPAPTVARSVSDPTEVVRMVQKDVLANPVGYLLAGTAYLVAVLGVVGVSVGVLVACMLPGMITEDETLLVVGGVAGFVVYMVAILGFSFVGFPAMSASFLRALDASWKGGPPIGFGSTFSTMREDWLRIAGFYLVLQLLALVGMLFLYLPGIVVLVVGTFAFPMVVLDRVPAMEAMKRGWEHVKANPGWHVGVWLLMMLVLVIAELTIVGLLVIYPVMVAWQLAAHRIAFGDTAPEA